MAVLTNNGPGASASSQLSSNKWSMLSRTRDQFSQTSNYSYTPLIATIIPPKPRGEEDPKKLVIAVLLQQNTMYVTNTMEILFRIKSRSGKKMWIMAKYKLPAFFLFILEDNEEILSRIFWLIMLPVPQRIDGKKPWNSKDIIFSRFCG